MRRECDYVDEQEHIDDSSKGVSIAGKTLKTVWKNDSVELPLGVFNDDSHAHISALILNSSATRGKVEAINDDPYPFIFSSAARFDPRSSDFYVLKGQGRLRRDALRRAQGLPQPLRNPPARLARAPGAGGFTGVVHRSQMHTWRYWMDRPQVTARNLITLTLRRSGSAS